MQQTGIQQPRVGLGDQAWPGYVMRLDEQETREMSAEAMWDKRGWAALDKSDAADTER